MKKLHIALFIGCATIISLNANINNVKGTYTILNDENKNLSAIHGTVAYESGAIRRMYDFGSLGKTADKIESKTILLIHKIFHRVPGSTSIADFVVTKKINAMPDATIAQFVADALINLEAISASTNLERYKKAYESYKEVKNTIKSETSEDAIKVQKEWESTRGSVTSLFKREFEVKKELKKKIELKGLEKVEARKRAATIHGLEESRKIEAKRILEKKREYEKNQPLYELIPFIIDAYLECAVEGFMPSYTPQLILQALLWAKTKDNRDALENYYLRLEEKKPGCLNAPAHWNTWKEDVFKREDITAFKAELEIDDAYETLNEVYEKYIFVAFSPAKYPREVPFSKPTIKEGNPPITFSDCVENIIRNMLNFLSYNEKTGNFETNLLKKRLNLEQIDTPLRNFYTKNPSAANTGEITVHDDWAQNVISNIPYVAYKSTLPTPATFNDFGFIHVPSQAPGLIRYLYEKNYTIVDQESIAYELNPSLKNFIIVVNHFLKLNLFHENLPQEFVREDFVEFYLPQLAEALKASIDSIPLSGIDKKDFTKAEIIFRLNFNFDGYKFSIEFMFTREHGGLTVTTDEQKTFNGIHFNQNSPLSTILMLTKDPILNGKSDLKTPQELLLWIFSQPIDNHAKGLSLSKKMFELNEAHLNDYCVQLLFFIMNEHPDKAKKYELLRTLVNKGKRLNDALAAAQIGIEHGDTKINGYALSLFETLVENEQFLPQALAAAEKGIKKADNNVKISSLKVLIKLVEKGHADTYANALTATKQYLKDKDRKIRNPALQLLIKLVEKGYEEAYADALALTKEKAFDEKKLLILEALVEKGYKEAYPEALATAQKYRNDSDENVKASSENLLRTLADKENKGNN